MADVGPKTNKPTAIKTIVCRSIAISIEKEKCQKKKVQKLIRTKSPSQKRIKPCFIIILLPFSLEFLYSKY